MASPQLENGYTRISNEILEALAKHPLNGTQWRILIVIFRYTYGFNQKEHGFSISFLLKAMGLKSSQYKQVCRELKSLFDMNILKEVEKPEKSTSRTISFNKNYNLWTSKTSGLIRPVDKLDQSEWTKKTREPLDELDHQQINNINKNLNKKICPFPDIVQLFNGTCASLSAVQKLTDSRKKKLALRWNEMPDINEWRRLFEIVENTPFLKGQNDRGWKVTFDWLIENDKNYIKVLEDQYAGSKKADSAGQKKEAEESSYRDLSNYEF